MPVILRFHKFNILLVEQKGKFLSTKIFSICFNNKFILELHLQNGYSLEKTYIEKYVINQ